MNYEYKRTFSDFLMNLNGNLESIAMALRNLSQKEISDATLSDEPSTTRMLDRIIKKILLQKEKVLKIKESRLFILQIKEYLC